jgi:hypothetical protein
MATVGDLYKSFENLTLEPEKPTLENLTLESLEKFFQLHKNTSSESRSRKKGLYGDSMSAWQGVVIDSLKYQ